MRPRTALLLTALAALFGFGQRCNASFIVNHLLFDVTGTPTTSISDSLFHYATQADPGGSTLDFGNYPANVATDTQIVGVIGAGDTLAPTWTWFGLYSVTQTGLAPVYGIAIALNTTAYDNLGSETFDQLFDTNVDAAYNNGQSYTEADLINQFLTNGVADAAFTAGISATPAAQIPYGQSGPIVLFSEGTDGGTIEATVTMVPEPASLGLFAAAAVGLSLRRRRPAIS
jgi:hypothetical protein